MSISEGNIVFQAGGGNNVCVRLLANITEKETVRQTGGWTGDCTDCFLCSVNFIVWLEERGEM